MARLRAAMLAAGSPIADIPVIWDDVESDPPKDVEANADVPAGKPWIRAGVRPDVSEPTSLGSDTGRRRHTVSGVMFAQLFTPYGDGGKLRDALVLVVLNAYRTGGATPSGVSFRRTRFEFLGKDRCWFSTLCQCEYTFDQFA